MDMFYAVLIVKGSTIIVNIVDSENQMRRVANTINRFGGSAMCCFHADKETFMKVVVDNPVLNWMGYRFVDHRKLSKLTGEPKQ